MQNSGFDRIEELRAELWDRHHQLMLRQLKFNSLPVDGRTKLVEDVELLFADSKAFDRLVTESRTGLVEHLNAWFCVKAIWVLVAEVYQKNGNLPAAIELLRTVVQRDPSFGEGVERLIRVLLESQQFLQAASVVNAASPSIFTEEWGKHSAQIIEWAMTYEEFATAILEERLVSCIRGVAKFCEKQTVEIRLRSKSTGGENVGGTDS